MSLTLLTGGNIVNVELVVVSFTPAGAQAKTEYAFKTSSQVTFTPAISAGQEKEQRIKNTLMGLIKTEDLIKGYDIELSDQRLIMDMFSLVNGGSIIDGSGDAWHGYNAPTLGVPTERQAFDLNIYTSDRDTDANVVTYYNWQFCNCKGKPVTVGAQDDDFYTIRYTIESRPAAGEEAMSVSKVSSLPAITPVNSGNG